MRPRGFTLVEVLVALLAMAILAAMSWRGLDAIFRARDISRDALDRSQRLATVVTQWEQDLQALRDSAVVPPLSFDGQTLRLTRRMPGGVAVVTWSLRSGIWQRWVGPTVTRVVELRESWLRSQGLLGNEPGHLTLAEGVTDYQVYFFRGGAWTNPQSTGDIIATPVRPAPAAPASAASGAAPAPAVVREVLPEAVRLVITLDGRTLTRDLLLGPGGSG